MGIISRVKNATRILLGYDVAKTTKENYKHWSGATGRTVQERNEPETRETIRKRARYEHNNNSYLQGMVTTASSELLGPTGPQLQVLTKNSKLNGMIEQKYREWAKHPFVNLAHKLRVLEESRMVEGEGFLNYVDDEELKKLTGIRLNVNPIAAYRVTDPDRYLYNMQKVEEGRFNDDGVIYDMEKGRPVEFNVLSIYEQITGLPKASTVGKRINAYSMGHWFTPKEVGQTRGMSEVQAALTLFSYLRRFTLATVSTAEIVACMTAFLKTTQQPEDQDPVPPWQETPIVRGMLQSLPEGWEPFQLEQKHPSSTYEMFVNLLLREIGRVLNMPFGIVSGDSSQYNYSSARLDFLDYQNWLKYIREQLCIIILDPLFAQWIVEYASGDPQVKAALDAGEIKHTWQFPSRPSINPLMDAQAEEIRLLNGSTTLAEVYADRGKNWEEELEQRKKEQDKINELGLSFTGTPVAEEIPESSEDTEEGEPIEEDEEELVPA